MVKDINREIGLCIIRILIAILLLIVSYNQFINFNNLNYIIYIQSN